MAEQHHKSRERALRLLKDGKVDAARDLLRTIVAEDPGEIACWARLAEIAQQRGAQAEAIEAYRAIADRCARDGLLFKAIGALKQIIAIDPTHHGTQELLASLYAKRTGADAPPRAATIKSRRPEEAEAPTRAPTLQELVSQTPRRPTQPPRPSTSPPRPAEVVTADGEVASLPRTPLFSELLPEAFVELLSGLRLRRLAENEIAVQEGERGDSFYIVVSGHLRVEKAQADADPVVLAHLSEGAFFGEMALIQESARTASVIAEEACELLELDRATLDGLVARHLSVAKALRDFYQQRLLSTAMAVHPFFQPFSPSERRELAALFQGRSFAAGEEVIREGEPGDGLYLLLSGHLRVTAGQGSEARDLANLGPGEMVGEISLLSLARTIATVRATDECWVLRLSREDFQRVAGTRPEVLQLVERVAEGRLDVNRSLLETPLA